ncbi:DUF2666 domain-containing protein [Thermococcus henrietii]|uniref:DUF2666 domain-containing protein n=1 Tax=Thermococcus henrietii TaxID=2016361 RepID=UPI000C06997C|nr:DUF2666 domain-containing protein [Thermococcus henrietii]
MKVEEHVAFTAKHGDWNVAKKLTDMENERIAHFLAGVSNTVNAKIGGYLSDAIDVEGVKALAGELRKDSLADTVVALKSPGTARKLGNLVNETDKKLRKLLVDVAKAYLVRETLRPLVPIDYPEGILEGVDVEFPFEDEHVNFTAKHGRWIVVKRLIIDEKTPMLDVARLLASINETATLKLPVYADIDVEGIEEEFSAFKKVKKSDIPKVIEVYEAFEPSLYADEPFEEHARVYALRIALDKIGLNLDVPAKSLEKYLEKKG